LFDRTADYAVLSQAMAGVAGELLGLDEAGARRRQRQLDQSLAEIERQDFHRRLRRLAHRLKGAAQQGLVDSGRGGLPGDLRAEHPVPRDHWNLTVIGHTHTDPAANLEYATMAHRFDRITGVLLA
jgi:hypothetical protein